MDMSTYNADSLEQWQHQLAEQEITDKGEADTMASDMALMEGLSALVPQLSAEIEETMLVVQSRNNMLRERMELAPMQELDAMERAGWGMANGEPYSEQALQRLAEEFTEVAGLQKQVEEGRRAMHTAEQDLARDMAAVGTETQKHVRAQETLKQQVEQQAIEVGELQERYSSVQRAQEAALALAARHRENMKRGDEMEARKLQRLQGQIERKRELRDREREEMSRITEKARRVKSQEMVALRLRIEQEERALANRVEVLLERLPKAVSPAAMVTMAPGSMPRTASTTVVGRPYVSQSAADRSTGRAKPAATQVSTARSAIPNSNRPKHQQAQTPTAAPPAPSAPAPAPAPAPAMQAGSVHFLANSDNPTVRAAARRVQAALAREL